MIFFLLFLFILLKRASPGIEPGPPAPKAGILPLNYKALIPLILYLSSFLSFPFLPSTLFPFYDLLLLLPFPYSSFFPLFLFPLLFLTLFFPSLLFLLYFPYFFFPYFSLLFLSFSFKKGLRRESNPGHPHPKRVFYHLTTKP